jgi:hypothetical protein
MKEQVTIGDSLQGQHEDGMVQADSDMGQQA